MHIVWLCVFFHLTVKKIHMHRCWVSHGHLMLTLLQLLITSQTCFSSYVLWPSWWWRQQGGVMAIYLVTEARNLRVNSDHSPNIIQNTRRIIISFIPTTTAWIGELYSSRTLCQSLLLIHPVLYSHSTLYTPIPLNFPLWLICLFSH